MRIDNGEELADDVAAPERAKGDADHFAIDRKTVGGTERLEAREILDGRDTWQPIAERRSYSCAPEEGATMSRSSASMPPSSSKAPTHVVELIDYVRADTIAELADFASSYWRSISEAARRGDRLTIEVHLRQVGAINREVKALVETLGTVDVHGGG
jgi:hypothetical protein